MDTRDKGNKCESQVADNLASNGHEIVCRNYRCKYGELDIISIKDGVLCVTEVKSLTSRWEAQEIRHMVPPVKLAKMKMTLSHFLANNEVEGFDSIRFDVAAVTGYRIDFFYGV